MSGRRRRLGAAQACSLVLVSASFAATTFEADAAPANPVNIIFIFVDDMGYGDLSCTGNKDVRTANIDRLAAEGTRFTQFYVASPICSPSRVAVTTGQYPSRHLIHSYLNSRSRNRSRGMRNYLDPKAPAVARTFKQHGYATAHFGKWHMGGGRDVDDAPLPKAYGFDESLVSFEGLGDRILPPGGLSRQSEKLGQGKIVHVPKHKMTELYVDRSIAFVRSNRRQPFYLHLWLNDVHDAHVPREDMLQKYERFKANPFVQRFYAVLDEMDRQIGRLVDAIDELGLAEKTLIVLTSDNGPTAWPNYYKKGFDPPGSTAGFRGRKWSLYEGGIRMPLIVRWPGRVPAGRVEKETILSAIDLFPTFCNLAKIKSPDVEFDGQDMGPAWLGTPMARQKPIMWDYRGDLKPGAAGDVSPTLAIRDTQWKLLVNANGSDRQLYNLEADRSESRNLVEEHPEVARRLSEQVLTWRRSLPSLASKTPDGNHHVEIQLAGRLRKLVNRGGVVVRDGLHLDGTDDYLDLPREQAPQVAGGSIYIRAEIEPERPDGVILAQGGDRSGYALFLSRRKPALAVCVNWDRVVLVAPDALPEKGGLVEANVGRKGRLTIRINGRIVATGRASGPLDTEPGDSLQIGADTIKPVGPYKVDHLFAGTIKKLQLEVAR